MAASDSSNQPIQATRKKKGKHGKSHNKQKTLTATARAFTVTGNNRVNKRNWEDAAQMDFAED
jgi:hypothetical protein